MQKFLLPALLTLAALPASAADYAALKREAIKNSKQETIALGNNRFLIFNGSKSPFQYVYGVELIKIEGGVPKLEPLFMEEFDSEGKDAVLSEGVGFPAMSYHFDKTTGRLDYTARDLDETMRSAYKYKLTGDTFKLLEIAVQDTSHCADASCKESPPKIIFDAAEAHAEKN